MSDVTVVVRLLDSIRDHLTTYRLSTEIASVEAACNLVDGEHVTVHLRHGSLPQLAAGLLDWADTLTHVTVTAWRPPPGTSVHLVLTGRLSDGTRATVYGGVTYTDELFGDLQPGGRHSVALCVLRAWAAGGGAVAA